MLVWSLDNKPNGTPILSDLTDALARAGTIPGYFIFGIAPASGMLSTTEREIALVVIGLLFDVVATATTTASTLPKPLKLETWGLIAADTHPLRKQNQKTELLCGNNRNP